jgi:uncharacterized protein (TIGR02466 family)
LKKFTADLALDMRGRALVMTDCWVNIMPKGVVHSLHLHPVSTISGTYYVQVPAGSSGLKFEDPRLDRFMAAPKGVGPRRLAAVAYGARQGWPGRALRKLAPSRGTPQPGGGRTGEHLVQFQLVLIGF